MTTAKPKRGRPPKPVDEVRAEIIRVRVTEAEKKSWDDRGGPRWLRRELKRKPRV